MTYSTQQCYSMVALAFFKRTTGKTEKNGLFSEEQKKKDMGNSCWVLWWNLMIRLLIWCKQKKKKKKLADSDLCFSPWALNVCPHRCPEGRNCLPCLWAQRGKLTQPKDLRERITSPESCCPKAGEPRQETQKLGHIQKNLDDCVCKPPVLSNTKRKK